MTVKAVRKPNIVFIMSDDQGAWALGSYGNREIITPNLDKMAQEGVRFENFYCVSPVCSPARASLLTGKLPSQHGVHDYLLDGNGGAGQRSIAYLEGQRGYTDILSDNGYHCGLSGKWHLGDGMRKQKSFDFWYVHQKGGGPYYGAPMFRDGQPVTEEGYITDIITDEAINYIRSRRGAETPFYLSVHYTAPHSPWKDAHPAAYTRLYEDCSFESCPEEPPHPWALTGIMPGYQDRRASLIGYYAAVTAMDANIGRIISVLTEEGMLEDTLLVFTSDNGFNCGHHGIWGKGNGTFPLNMYESSVRVPLLVMHKGHLPGGRVCRAILSAYDWFPTLLDYVGCEYVRDDAQPGKSFAGYLRGEHAQGEQESQLPGEAVVFDEYGPVRMIREARYKYVHRYPYGENELYDLQEDPGERVNLCNTEAGKPVAARLRARLTAWFVRYADPAVDGSREAVKGGGQRALAGLWGDGSDIYPANDHI